MTTLSDKIRAVVEEAERRLEAAEFVMFRHGNERITDANGDIVALPVDNTEAALIVSVVNRERGQIEHARDVLGRHPRTDDPKHGSICETCRCGCDEFCQTGAIWPCPEILSLARGWGVEP